MNAYLTSAASHRQQQAAIGGCEWVLEPACDSHVSGSVRYSAAVILRNLSELLLALRFCDFDLWSLCSDCQQRAPDSLSPHARGSRRSAPF
jgi:hypothetical protein